MIKFLAGRNILVVEDEMIVLMNIEHTLADFGCEAVSAAATVDRALALVEEHRFDLAMLDVNLGGETSYLIADALALRAILRTSANGAPQRTKMGTQIIG